MVKKYGVDNGAASIGALLIVRGIKTHTFQMFGESSKRPTHFESIYCCYFLCSFREKEERQSLQIK